MTTSLAATLAQGVALVPAHAQRVDWPAPSGDAGAMRWSPLDDVNRGTLLGIRGSIGRGPPYPAAMNENVQTGRTIDVVTAGDAPRFQAVPGIGKRIAVRPRAVWIGTTALLAIACLGLFRLDANGDLTFALAEPAPEGGVVLEVSAAQEAFAAELGALIRQVRDERNLTVLLVEHHMNLVMDVSEHICVLNFGQRIAEHQRPLHRLSSAPAIARRPDLALFLQPQIRGAGAIAIHQGARQFCGPDRRHRCVSLRCRPNVCCVARWVALPLRAIAPAIRSSSCASIVRPPRPSGSLRVSVMSSSVEDRLITLILMTGAAIPPPPGALTPSRPVESRFSGRIASAPASASLLLLGLLL